MDVNETLRTAYQKPGVTNSVASLYKAVKNDGITQKQVKEFFANQKTFQLQKTKRIDVYGGTVIPLENTTFELDLADLSSLSPTNGDVHFFLVLVDSLTKFTHVLPLKNNSATEVNKLLKAFIKTVKPKSFVSDPGSEFTNDTFKKLLQEENIQIS